MITFDVTRINTWITLKIRQGDMILKEALDEHDAVELAKVLIKVAEDLLPVGTGEQEFNLSKIRESL